MLFTPFQLGRLTLKNRIVALPVFTGYALPDGRVSNMLVDHYTELGRSGAAMVVVANAAVSPDGVTSPYNLRADRDDFIPGLARLARNLKKNGALACLQLNHAGRFAKTEHPLQPSPLDGANLTFNVSSLKDFMNSFPLARRFGLTQDLLRRFLTWNRAMTGEEKERTIDAFGSAAARAVEAGFDLIELHGATGYLLAQFLSPFTHKVDPHEGDPSEIRMAFPLAVLDEVRHRIPPDFPVGFRLMLREWVPGGIELKDALAFAARLEAKGTAYLSAAAGTYNSIFLKPVARNTAKPAYLQRDVAALTRSVKVPAIIAGRITKPELAEKILRRGAAPLIGVGRSLRVDSEWVQKASKGIKTTPCLNCNHCLKQVTLGRAFTCSRWPRWRQEKTDLEHKLLSRGWFHDLVVAADEKDMLLLSETVPFFLPDRHGISASFLLLAAREEDQTLEKAWADFRRRNRQSWTRRPFSGGRLAHQVARAADKPDDRLREEVDRGGYGTVLLCRNPGQPWREHFLYKQRSKVLGLLGPHPRRNRVLVPLDLSDMSPLVLSYVCHALLGKPGLFLDIVHVLEGPSGQAMRRWDEMMHLLDFPADFRLRLVPTGGDVAADILRIAGQQDCGVVVMGKRGLSGIKRLLLGSVSASVAKGLTNQSLFLID